MSGALWWDRADTTTQNFDLTPFHRGPLARGEGVGMKLLVHSVEGSGWPGYGGGASAPHFTVRFDLQRHIAIWRQHWPLDRYARALKTDGTRINDAGPVQVEVIGTSGWATEENPKAPWHVLPVVPDLPDWCWLEMARFLVWLHTEHDVALELVPGGFVPWTRSSRMPYAQWVAFSGVIGHQHAPANDHTDPGDIPGDKIIDFARRILAGEIFEEETMKYPSIGSKTFFYDLPKVLRYEGYEIYDDPTYVDRGYCYYGSPTHKHMKGSLHFDRLAFDFGRDPAGGPGISDYERAYIDAKVLMLSDYYGNSLGRVWNRGPTDHPDHPDHAHVDNGNYGFEGKYTGKRIAGVILYGEVSDAVRRWQDDLKKTGQTLEVDGIFRLGTFWATKDWQQKRGLVADGIIGGASQREMAKHLQELSQPKPTDWSEIYKNYTREMILAAQHVLSDLGYKVGVIDGIAGPKFHEATKAAQADYNITPVDGFPGPETMRVLLAVLAELLKPVPEPTPDPPSPPETGYADLRIYGDTRWDTAVAVTQAEALPEGRGVLLSADGTTDLIMGGWLAAQSGVDVLPVRYNGTTLPGPVSRALKAGNYEWVRVIGGEGAISDYVVREALEAIGIIS